MLRRKFNAVGLGLTLLLTAAPAAARRDPAPGFERQSLALPGMPAAILGADVDRDGRRDLVVLVAYRRWDSVAQVERTSFDGIEGLVEVMNVVDALVDRRELRVYPASGGEPRYGPRHLSLELATSVHALATGHPAHPLVALTDEGVAAVEIEDGGEGPRLTLTPLLETASSLRGGGAFYADLRFLTDLDGDTIPDLLLPVADGWEVHRGLAAGFDGHVAAALHQPPAEEAEGEETGAEPSDDDRDARRPPLPETRDVNGDGRLDVLLLDREREHDPPVVWLQRAGLAFAPGAPLEVGEEAADEAEGAEIVFVGDLDGDHRAELVTQQQIELPEDAGFRKSIEDAKRPHHRYRIYGIERDLAIVGPLQDFTAIGYAFTGDGDGDVALPGGFQDLDGDGRLDLVSITLDFSVLPLLARVLVVRRLSLRLDFHPWCREDDGRFVEVPGLDLSGKFKLNLRNTRIKHLSQFAGDFDGDGRADFVQLGRGKNVSIHLGEPGCRYPSAPDRTIQLAKEPKHLGLVRILDLDADGRSDLYVVHPQKPRNRDESVPARLDLYLSRPAPGARP